MFGLGSGDDDVMLYHAMPSIVNKRVHHSLSESAPAAAFLLALQAMTAARQLHEVLLKNMCMSMTNVGSACNKVQWQCAQTKSMTQFLLPFHPTFSLELTFSSVPTSCLGRTMAFTLICSHMSKPNGVPDKPKRTQVDSVAGWHFPTGPRKRRESGPRASFFLDT